MIRDDESTPVEVDWSTWRGQEPPPSFALQVSDLISSEASLARKSSSKKFLLPLFLAASLFSAGAAATWSEWSRPVAPSWRDGPSGTWTPDDTAINVRVVLSAPSVRAEPDRKNPVPSVPVPRPARIDQPPPASEPSVVAAPGVTHWPRCVCSPQGVVCGCSD